MGIAPVRVLRPMAVRAGVVAVPVVSPGPLCAVPSLVIAPRRGSRADWGVFGAFCPVLAAWLAKFAPTPDTTHGAEFAADVLLILLSTAAASVHAWKVRPRRPPRP